jgi:hypothetical protein
MQKTSGHVREEGLVKKKPQTINVAHVGQQNVRCPDGQRNKVTLAR